ncbi:tripartite tricarboxylate transporter TctB family protein [Salinicola acroporae]|nr:tripartite tricarboxylate transporter TctB family protein [Salinicola acroporae]
MILRKADCWLALLMLAFCAFVTWRTLLIPSSGAGGQAGPDFFPWLAIIGITALSVALFIRGLCSKVDDVSAESTAGGTAESGAGRYATVALILFVALMVGYAAAFERIGYLLSTLVTFVIGMLLLRERRVLQFLIVPALIVAGVYFGFTHLLDVYLP